MSIVQPKLNELKKISQVVGQIITWENVKANDICEWAEGIGIKRSVVLIGELGKANCLIEGSNDKKNVGILHSDMGLELNLTSVDEYTNIVDASYMIRPTIVDGDENTNLTISIMVVS